MSVLSIKFFTFLFWISKYFICKYFVEKLLLHNRFPRTCSLHPQTYYSSNFFWSTLKIHHHLINIHWKYGPSAETMQQPVDIINKKWCILHNTSHQEVIPLLHLCHPHFQFIPPYLPMINLLVNWGEVYVLQYFLQNRNCNTETFIVSCKHDSGVLIFWLGRKKYKPHKKQRKHNLWITHSPESVRPPPPYAFLWLLVFRIMMSNKNITISDMYKSLKFCGRKNFGGWQYSSLIRLISYYLWG